jgi:hypothetical protein
MPDHPIGVVTDLDSLGRVVVAEDKNPIAHTEGTRVPEDSMANLTHPDAQLEYDRVRQRSTGAANRAIDARTRASIERAAAGGRAAIEQRLVALQQEWDIDRVLMVNFATLVFAQLVAATRDRRWLWGPLVQTPFLMMHATLGWCPPSLWFRPLGFRTRFEIQAEREALLQRLGELPA